jgi:hypothetical protein
MRDKELPQMAQLIQVQILLVSHQNLPIQVTLLQTVNRARLQLMCRQLLHWMMPLRLHQWRTLLQRLIRWLTRSVVRLTVVPRKEHHLRQKQW